MLGHLGIGKAIPTRPVINGKGGFNSHLSEVLSMIVGPISKEASGNEINSTADLLAGIDSINSKVSQDPEPSRVSDNDEDDDWCYHCNRCNSDEATEEKKDEARRLIDRVSNKRVMTAKNVSNTLKSKLNASRAATVLYQK